MELKECGAKLGARSTLEWYISKVRGSSLAFWNTQEALEILYTKQIESLHAGLAVLPGGFPRAPDQDSHFIVN